MSLDYLESRIAYAEHNADQLDEALLAQQRQIEALTARLATVERLLARLDPSLLSADAPPE